MPSLTVQLGYSKTSIVGVSSPMHLGWCFSICYEWLPRGEYKLNILYAATIRQLNDVQCACVHEYGCDQVVDYLKHA